MTEALLLAMALLALVQRADTFDVRSELQGLYDEMSQATLQYMTAADIDDFHAVLTTPDWVFVDETGQRHDWSQMRDEAIRALSAPRPDSIAETINKMSLETDAAVVVVNQTTVHPVADEAQRVGRGTGHALAATTTFRDRWVHVGDTWKLQSRQQIGKAVESVIGR